MTVIGIGVAAAVTAGLLVAAGVGDEESRSVREARVREERINGFTEQIAANIIRQNYFCDLDLETVRGRPVPRDITILVQASRVDDLSESEWREVSNRLSGELESQCTEGAQ